MGLAMATILQDVSRADATGLCFGNRRVRHKRVPPMSKRDQKCGPTGIPRLDALREARRHSRFKLYVEVKIHSPSLGSVLGKTLEISERGLSATLSVDLPVGEVVELAPRFSIGRVNVYATVRNRNGFRHGFQFGEPNPARHLIRENCCLLERIPSDAENRTKTTD